MFYLSLTLAFTHTTVQHSPPSPDPLHKLDSYLGQEEIEVICALLQFHCNFFFFLRTFTWVEKRLEWSVSYYCKSVTYNSCYSWLFLTGTLSLASMINLTLVKTRQRCPLLPLTTLALYLSRPPQTGRHQVYSRK